MADSEARQLGSSDPETSFSHFNVVLIVLYLSKDLLSGTTTKKIILNYQSKL